VFFLELPGCRLSEDEAMPISDSFRAAKKPRKKFVESQRSNSGTTTEEDSFRRTAQDVEEGGGVMFDKVLVVEDSKFNRKMMGKILSSYAKKIVMAEDGVEGVAAVRESMANKEAHFDIIFMDSLMPNMNEIDATKCILRELKFPNPIVAITGNMLPDDVKEFEDAGALTVLGKPLQLDRLNDVLRGIHMRKGGSGGRSEAAGRRALPLLN
jgi:CheY-like chemotaxis protein